MGNTSIEWTDKTWNPTRGCSRVSEGCRNCYAERQAARFAGIRTDNRYIQIEPVSPFHGFVQIANGHPQWTGKVELMDKVTNVSTGYSTLTMPLHWKKPARIFVNSMSDLFHEALPDDAIDRVFAVMTLCPQHTFQVLTKRPERMLEWSKRDWSAVVDGTCIEVERGRDEAGVDYLWTSHPPYDTVWPLPNVWLGVSVEDQKTADERIPLLLRTPAAVRFVSYEPALGPVDFTEVVCGVIGRDALRVQKSSSFQNEQHLDWVIVGGESGPGSRPFDIAWARNTIAQCKAAGVACFVKQLGAKPFENKGEGFFSAAPHDCPIQYLKLRDRKGGSIEQWPEDLRVREFPKEERC